MFCGGVLRFGAVAVSNRGTHRAKAEKNFDGSTTGRYVTAEKQESVGRRREEGDWEAEKHEKCESAAQQERQVSGSAGNFGESEYKGKLKGNAAGKIGRFCINKAVYTH